MSVVYGYFRGSECFYIGIGSKKRSRQISRHVRNNYTYNKIQKAIRENCFHVQIFHSGIDRRLACWYEKIYIQQLGRLDLGTGCLTNMTDGGEGVVNLSKEKLKIISESNKGRTPWNKGKNISEETKRKISKEGKGKKRNNKTRYLISKANKGENNSMYGKPAVNRKKVVIGDKIFNTVKEASEYIGITRASLRNRIKSKNYPDHRYG